MTTVIISKIQHRTGNIADLPQLDTAEIALAVDLTTPGQPQNRLFFGPAAPVFTNSSPSSNNIEILTQYSGVSSTTITEADAANPNVYYPVMAHAVSGSLGLWANANLRFDVPSEKLFTTYLDVQSDAVIGGNLVIDGSLVYVNVETLLIEDPLIGQGTGPNGGFVPIADIKDRGAIYHFFGDGTTFDNLRFNGWDTSASEFAFASDVTLNVNETVTINQYGNTRAFNGNFLGNVNVTGNVSVTGNYIVPGGNTQVLFNDQLSMNATSGFTFNKLTNNVTSTGSFISTIATGTAPLAVTSTTRVTNLHVENSLESEVTLTSAGTYYLDLLPATSGNIQHYANASLSFNAATGILTAVGGFNGPLIAPGGAGNNTQVFFNDAGFFNTDAGLTFDKVTNNLTATGSFISTIATGTAPLAVTSTTRVTNLHVENSLESEVTLTSAGTYYLDLLSATSGNIQHYANADLSFDAATGILTAVGGFNGPLIAPGGAVNNTQVFFNDAGSFNTDAGLTFDKVTNNLTATGSLISTVATGTAPLAVTSTTRVTNLHVENSLESEVTLTSAGTYYLDLLSATSGNIQHYANADLSFDAATGILTAVGGFNGPLIAPGGAVNNTQVFFNDAGSFNTDAGLTFDKVTNNLTATGSLISSVATGTAPLAVTSTTRVNNLYVEGANLSNIQLATAGTYYLNFTSATSGNLLLNANADLSFNAATGVLTSVGGFSGPYITTSISTGAAATAGTITGTWSLSPGSSLQATYADLAEYYVSDLDYEPGTVLEFGGEYEVTVAEDETTRVAGVVSTNPAYVMNSNLEGKHVVPVALTGRVPCKVRGNIRKGDMMISGGDGFARPTHSPKMGTIIGKALENFNGEGIIEIVVGRL
jgi:hypothetical protein